MRCGRRRGARQGGSRMVGKICLAVVAWSVLGLCAVYFIAVFLVYARIRGYL